MSEPILVPRLGLTVEEVTIVEWQVSDGDVVTEGDVIVTVATDKVETEITAPNSGKITIEAKPDDVCEVGTAIGTITE
ncbi:biotin/lipoyl-containing protein [Mycobacterium vicinigordonae]|uniref:Dihydrolipoamide acyltransferase n=1 Tax=Mycobacterium vicinigordonae TaxID=1719132 RepID=A0A7D6E7T4_9MYCO|nr:biotin/lipoyl-containing protein [Mycobacterium vicinigordonae]QLL08723.1 dihydrolipoamide acyltransferase [Mycobacterium vicinigordonae]